ncbi:MAG: hypothetical protein A3J24_07785 [Deltaproteobacteria bacterium RIFCSPLOWO2_02_FULL_53_8]|nr:MAG: hypothetical protein A3J24_07785 [Deltaproteobacteria bacterium RIFCSPLOWO2_02_FULL_53_8]
MAIFLLVCAPVGVIVSLLLIFKPQLMERLNRVANRWLTARRLNQFLDRSISIERWFYRYHRPFGAVVMLGALYIVIYFGILFDKAYALQRLNWRVPPRLMDGLLDALVLSSLAGAVTAFMVGLFLWLRPSLLKGIEVDANQWISSRRAIKMLEVPRDQVELFVARHMQRVGWLILLGSSYLFFLTFCLLM